MKKSTPAVFKDELAELSFLLDRFLEGPKTVEFHLDGDPAKTTNVGLPTITYNYSNLGLRMHFFEALVYTKPHPHAQHPQYIFHNTDIDIFLNCAENLGLRFERSHIGDLKLARRADPTLNKLRQKLPSQFKFTHGRYPGAARTLFYSEGLYLPIWYDNLWHGSIIF